MFSYNLFLGFNLKTGYKVAIISVVGPWYFVRCYCFRKIIQENVFLYNNTNICNEKNYNYPNNRVFGDASGSK